MRTAMTYAALLVSALAVGLGALPASAAETWTGGGGGDTSWTNTANWSGGVPANMADVIFGTGGSEAALVYGVNVDAITFNRTGDFQVLGNTVAGGPVWCREFNIYGGVSVTQPNTYTISVRTYRVMLMANQTIDVVSGGKLLFNTAPTGTHHFGGFKAYTVTKTGDGVLEFAGGAGVTYLTELGSLDIQGGSVRVATPSMSGMGALSGSGDFTATGGVTIKQYVDGVFQGHIDLGGSISMFKDASGKLTISGAGGYITGTGEVALRGGMLELDNSTVNRNNRLTGAMISLNGGTLRLVGNDSVNMVENASAGASLCVWGGAGELNINHGASADATISFGGVGHDDGSPGGAAGMLLFTGADIGASAPGPSSHVMLSSVPLNDSIVGWWRVGDEFASYNATVGVLPLAAGHASRTGNLVTATGADNVLATSAQTLTGNVTANSLKIQGGHGIDLGGNTLTLDTGGLIQTGSANSTGIHSGSLAATGNQLYVQAATDLNIGASVSGITLTKMGTGKLTLGDVSLSQGVVLCEGDIDVNNNAAMKLTVNNAGKAGELSKGGTGILTVAKGASSDVLIGHVYVNDGTMQFGAGAVFAPTSTVHVIGDGVLQATYASQWFGMPEGWVSLESGGRYVFYDSTNGYSAADLKLTVVDEGEIYNPGTGERHIEVLSGAGRLVKWGANPICFDNSLADLAGFTGTLDVAEGTFRVDVADRPANAAGFHVRSGATLNWYNPVTVADYVFSGDGTVLVGSGSSTLSVQACTFSPGASVGTLAITGNLSLGQDAVLDIEMTDSSTADVLAVTGAVSGLANTDVVFNLPVPSKAKFDIITGVNATFLTAGSVSGNFAAVSMSTAMAANVASHYSLGPGDIDTSSGTARALVLTGACWTGHDGDTNLDDDVDVLDLANMANNFGRDITDPGVSWLTSDYNIDGEVDVLDLAKMANNFGWSSGAGGGEAVPEPFTVAILAVGAVAVIRRRRR